MFLSDSLLILLPIAKCNDFEYFPSSNISPRIKCFLEFTILILSKLFNADFKDNGFEL